MKNMYELSELEPETEIDMIYCRISPFTQDICGNIEIDGSLFANTLPYRISEYIAASSMSKFKVSKR